MKKNLYYSQTIRRNHLLKKIMTDVFLLGASYPRMVIEVFIRKNFGERYFRLWIAIVIALVLVAVPVPFYYIAKNRQATGAFFSTFLTWYIFTGLFVYFSIERYKEIRRKRSLFDFSRFSLYSGKVHPIFSQFPVLGMKPTIRNIEIFYEPVVAFVVGFILFSLTQPVGLVLVFCSLAYSLGSVVAYQIGDDFVLDKIDQMICNEELEKAFVEDAPEDETRDFRFVGRKPVDPDMRRQLMPEMIVEEEVYDVL